LPEGPITPELRRVVERALDKRPEHRYADASAMLSDLQFMTRASTADHDDGPKRMPPSAPNFNDQPGDMIAGKYRLGKVIGAGGFSRVLKATHIDMERTVAIKILDLEGAVAQAGGTTAQDLKTRFGREAKMSSRLQHPNTITVFDFGVDELGRWYIVMEYIDGINLYAAVRRGGKFAPKRAARIGRDILRSLAEAHHLGFLHRDLKPGNIMLSEDFMGEEAVKVLDFGIATVVDSSLSNQQFAAMKATQMGNFVGTPQYAAPEQFLGERLTPSTDVYMLGLVIWEMLMGKAAIVSDSFGECLKTHLDPTPWRFPPAAAIPEGLAQILYGALEKDMSKRYLSATEMADDLDGWLEGEERDFAPSPTTEERWEPALDDYKAVAEAKQRQAAARKPKAEPSTGEPEPLMGTGERFTFDPNLDEEFEPDFLKPPKPVETRRGKKRGQRGGLSSIPKFQEAKIELDLPTDSMAVEPRRDRQVRPVEPPPSQRQGPDVDWSKLAAGAGILIVAVVAWAALQGDEAPPPTVQVRDITKVEPMHLEDFENSLIEPEAELEHRYSTEGILKAVQTAGWSTRRGGDTRALANVHEQSYKISRADTTMEIRVVTTKSRRTAQKMFEDTREPIGAILFDNKLVRIFPPAGKHHPDVNVLIGLLREYREFVAEAGNE
jgi:serine/threonine protein kinase